MPKIALQGTLEATNQLIMPSHYNNNIPLS